MNIVEWYVVFHPRRRGLGLLGHVEAIGVTEGPGATFVFLNPAFQGFDIDVIFKHGDKTAYLAAAFDGNLVLRVQSGPGTPSVAPMMSCAAIVGHMVGWRAFTPWGLRRKLLRNGAEVIHDGTGRKQGVEGAADEAKAGSA